jgi:hypothetical protein
VRDELRRVADNGVKNSRSQSNRAPMKCGHWRAIHPHREGILKVCSCRSELRMYSRNREIAAG